MELIEGDEVVRCRRGVVLCAGAIGTPAILLRSGIGPAAELACLGITPLLDRPGVGARLWDHPHVPVRLVPLPGECDPLRDPRFQMVARFNQPDGAAFLMALVSFLDVSGMAPLRALAGGAAVVALVTRALMDPRGHGRLRLASANPRASPHIGLGFDGDPDDMRALADGVRLSWRIACRAPVAEATLRCRESRLRNPAVPMQICDMLIGYARVSTDNHDLRLQRAALKEAGCRRIFAEKVSGARCDRPELARMLDQLRDDDVVVVTRLDRLARSARDLLDVAEKLNEAAAGLRSLAEPWADTTSPAGRMVLTVFAGIAEFERELIHQRTNSGRVAAKVRGVRFGRLPKLTADPNAWKPSVGIGPPDSCRGPSRPSFCQPSPGLDEWPGPIRARLHQLAVAEG